MKVLYTPADGLYLCLLEGKEVTMLQRLAVSLPRPDALMHEIAGLPLDNAIVNAIARSAVAQPELFLNQDGSCMSLATWTQAVLYEHWKAPGIGELRLQKLRDVLTHMSASG